MPRSPQIVRLAGALMFVLSTSAVAQNGPPRPEGHPGGSPDAHATMGRDAAEGGSPLVEDLAELRAKVARLEAALEQNHQGHSSRGAKESPRPGMGMEMGGMSGMGGDGMKGMKDMGSGGKMSGGMEGKGMDEMSAVDGRPMKGKGMSQMEGMDGMGGDGMGGMKMMGRMKGMSEDMANGRSGGGAMEMNSALPGFPGASHLYHVGAVGFFLDHDEHITLTAGQTTSLNRIKEATLLASNTAGRQIDEAEQQLWELTAAESPDAKPIEEKIREIERLRGDQRLEFIQTVGEAAKVLTVEQRQSLTGLDSAPSASDTQDAQDAQPASNAAQHQH